MNISELSDKHSGLYRIESSSSKEIATHQFKEIDNTFDNFADTKEIKIETQMVQELGLCGNFLFWLKSLNGRHSLKSGPIQRSFRHPRIQRTVRLVRDELLILLGRYRMDGDALAGLSEDFLGE